MTDKLQDNKLSVCRIRFENFKRNTHCVRDADELLRSFLFWICKNIQYIALFNQLPLRQNGHAVTDALDDVQFMRNQKDRDMQFLIDFEQQF